MRQERLTRKTATAAAKNHQQQHTPQVSTCRMVQLRLGATTCSNHHCCLPPFLHESNASFDIPNRTCHFQQVPPLPPIPSSLTAGQGCHTAMLLFDMPNNQVSHTSSYLCSLYLL
jgi:hypothetical protein